MKQLRDFFTYSLERYSILQRRRAGQKPPWTEDPILRKYRFCNIFREDDTVTQWIKQNLRDPLAQARSPHLITIMVAARFINRVSTLEELKHIFLVDGWNSKLVKKQLRHIRSQGQPIVTGAYMIRTPFGMDKIEGLDVIMRPLQKHRWPTTWPTLEAAHKALTAFPYVGTFMAYEAVTDLRWTHVLENASDIDSWAAAGPGAARGLSRVEFGELGHYHYGARVEELNAGMGRILERSWGIEDDPRVEGCLPAGWEVMPNWEMREVEHTLCEFDKYERARLGQGEPKQLYKPTI